MKADALIRWFMPREERFQDLLAQDTGNLLAAAEVFSEVAGTTELAERRVHAARLKELEHEGDQITRRIFDALNSTFITPFDREDIRSIATDLDDVLDYVEGVAHYLVLFELAASPEALQEFAGIVVKMAQEIDSVTRLIWDMANERQIQQCIMRISELENEADRLHSREIAELFRPNGRDPLDILKWKEVYDGLENACDQCKDYSHVLGNVLVKNS